MTEEELKRMENNHKLVLSLMNLVEEMSKDYEEAKVFLNNLGSQLGSLCAFLDSSGFPKELTDILTGMGRSASDYASSMQNLTEKHIKALSRFEFTGNRKE